MNNNRPNISNSEATKNSASNTISRKTKDCSFRGFVSIDQEMGREIAMMFFKPSKKISLSESGHLAGKL